MTRRDTPETAFRPALAAWNDGNLSAYLGLYADTVEVHGYTPVPMDKAAVTEFYQAIFAGFPDTQLAVHDELWDTPRVAVRATMTGTHTGEFNSIPPTGREIELPLITILQFDGNRVTERWSQADMLGLMTQLGAIPAPG